MEYLVILGKVMVAFAGLALVAGGILNWRDR